MLIETTSMSQNEQKRKRDAKPIRGEVMRQLAAQRVFVEPPRTSAVKRDSGTVNLNHVLLLALERALVPPLFHRRSVFQPMRIVVVDPALLARTCAGDDPQMEMPNVLPRALPPASDAGTFEASRLQHRAVRGEILSDESGRLYEKLGRQIRPIHQLASGQFGDVVDLVPTSASRMIHPAAGPKAVELAAENKAQSAPAQGGNNMASEGTEFVPLKQTQSRQTTAASHRKLFADPGQWRVVRWGEFKEILAPQLAHPERLRDTYRLPCYVQVLETERAVSIEELAGVYKSDNHARLYFLTDEIAAKLDLVLPLRPAPARREANTLLAHERVFRLLAANDPTVDVKISQTRLPSMIIKKDSSSATGKNSNLASSTVQLKDTIPNDFVKEWEFKLTREEASYEINAKPTIGNLMRNLWRRLRVIKRGTEFRKWQTLLAGRGIDEQLWVVRPPAGMLTDSFVREWAEKTLEHGGYDSRKMITEWEIFWRRRGL
jgi:hypothetical protein